MLDKCKLDLTLFYIGWHGVDFMAPCAWCGVSGETEVFAAIRTNVRESDDLCCWCGAVLTVYYARKSINEAWDFDGWQLTREGRRCV